jgi:hypothetical protein
MYRPRHFRWKLMHLFNMLAHLGLVVAVAISYIYDLGITTQSISRGRPTPAGVSTSACSPASLARVESGFTFDMATHTLLKACLNAVSSLPTFLPPFRPSRMRPCATTVSQWHHIRFLSDLPNISFLLRSGDSRVYRQHRPSCFASSRRTQPNHTDRVRATLAQAGCDDSRLRGQSALGSCGYWSGAHFEHQGG